MTNNKNIGFAALLCAAFYIIVGMTHFLMPSAQLHFSSGVTSEFFISLTKNATAFHVHYWAFVIASILNIGVIYGVTNHLKFSAFYQFTAILAIIGLSVTAYDFARMHYQAIHLAEKFVTSDAFIKDIILIQGLDRLDAYGIGFNLLGFYLFILSYHTLGTKIWSRTISIIGILAGILLQFVLIGILTRIGILIDIAAGMGGIVLAPLFFIGIGLFYIKEDAKIP